MRAVATGVLVVAMVGLAGGCARGRAGGNDPSARPHAPVAGANRPASTPVREAWPLPVWPGTTLVIPWAGPVARLGEGVRVTGPTGQSIPAAPWRLWIEPAGALWAGPVAEWNAEPVPPGDDAALARATQALDQGRVDGRASWIVLAIDLPPDFHGEEIVVDGTRLRVAPSPELLDSAWLSPMPPWASWPILLDAARPDQASPSMRWRASLLRAGVPDDPTRALAAFDEPVLEALAVQEELRWRAALTRLHRADPALADRVRARLLPVVASAQGGLVVPLWTQDAQSLSALRDILLDDRTTGAALASRAESWLRRQPEAVAWFEHAFAQDAPGAPTGFVRAWVGNASSRQILAWMEFRAEHPAGIPAPEPVLLAPGELRLLEAPVSLPAYGSERLEVRVHAGAHSVPGQVILGSIPARPPGVTLGPLAPVHDAASVLGAEIVVAETGECVALLRRLDPPGPAPGRVAARARWSLLIECATPPDAGIGSVAAEFSHDGGRTRITVRGDGALSVDAPAGLPVTGYPSLAPVVAQAGRWTAEVPVPDWCVGLDGKLRGSLVRYGEGGGIWSWPVSTLRLAPDRGGRAVIDLDAWDEASRN